MSAAISDIDHRSFPISVENTLENLVALAGQLAWLVAVCRGSQTDRASYSHISFVCLDEETNVFEIIPLPLKGVEARSNGDPVSCWLPIFKRGIIAHGFPVPKRQGEKGIELPFSLMTDQAGILYPIKYKGRVYLRGFSCILFPTSASNKFQAVQWHLVHSGDSKKRLPHGTLPTKYQSGQGSEVQWLKSTNMKKLSTSPRTFLGYCKHVEVHLCNEQGSINRLDVSGAHAEKHMPGLLWKSITASFSVRGILGFLLNAEITRPRGLTEEARERRLQPMLNEAIERPVMLYDTATQRAWLVPTISAILLMVRVHVREDPSLLAKLPPATPSWDAAQEAMAVIRAKEGEKLRQEVGERNQRSVTDLLSYLVASIDSKVEKTELAKYDHMTSITMESRKVYGWELLDIAKERRVKRKQTRCSASWTMLTDEVLVLFGRDFGEIIRPAADTSICTAWNPLPAKKQYMTATIKCLQDWSRSKWGASDIQGPCLKILDEAYWEAEAYLFDNCSGRGASSRPGDCQCMKKPQHISKHAPSSSQTIPLPTKGGVVFGSRKLQKQH